MPEKSEFKITRYIRNTPAQRLIGADASAFCFIKEMPGQGRFYEHRENSELVAFADYSGDYPEITDDGVLTLDFTRPIVVRCHGPHARDIGVCIPLIDERGEKAVTHSSWTVAYWLRKEYGFRIELPIDESNIAATMEAERVDDW